MKTLTVALQNCTKSDLKHVTQKSILLILRICISLARFRVQCEQYFPSFSFVDLITTKMRNEENFVHLVRDKRAITSLSLS